MNAEKINLFLMSNAKNFKSEQIPYIKARLEQLDDDKLMLLSSADFKNPTTMLIVSLLVGGLGVDRFMIGDTGMGVLKLLTGGCFGILTIIDWCTIMNKTRDKNIEIFESIVNFM